MNFKTKKSKKNFDDQVKSIKSDKKNKKYHVLYAAVSRVFIVEMMWSYMLCENEELLNYYLQYGPIKSYFKK